MITSKSNSRIRNLVTLRRKASERSSQDVFLVEGIKMFREIPADQMVEVYASTSFLKTEAGKAAIEQKKEETQVHKTSFEEVSDEVFQILSDTRSPQGVMAVVRQQHYDFQSLLGETAGLPGMESRSNQTLTEETSISAQPLVMVLENLQDPGNLGTIIRTSEGAGVTGILMSRGTADLYNPKVTRSTMGSIFRMPFLYTDNLKGDIERLKKAGVTVCAAHLKGKNTYDREDYTIGTAFMIGNESKGLSDEIADLADVRVRIPMAGKVESLNASVAAAILMYEASRQRHTS